MKGPGGTNGGTGQFFLGLGLALLAMYLFFNSVYASTGNQGAFSGLIRRGWGGGGGVWETTSMGIIFVPFFLGVAALFYDSRMQWAWVLMWIGVAVVAIEILSRIRFQLQIKTSSLMGMIVLFGAGTGLMLRSYRENPPHADDPEDPDGKPPTRPNKSP